uniref:Uncharacterized protein n=1 Tax=Anguilla anguilla TaxID=7936 RepID=A0A0E9P5Y4_ANGAN
MCEMFQLSEMHSKQFQSQLNRTNC